MCKQPARLLQTELIFKNHLPGAQGTAMQQKPCGTPEAAVWQHLLPYGLSLVSLL